MTTSAADLRPAPITSYGVVRLILGLILLAAALLKGHQLATEPVAETGPLTSRWFLIGVVEFELFFGLWLLSGLYPRRTWQAALVCFGAFACVSLYKALSGETSCGCFGRVPVDPWYTGTLDLAIVVSLLRWRPTKPSSADFRQVFARAMCVLVIWLAVGVPAAYAMVSYDALARTTSFEMGPVCFDQIKIPKHDFRVFNDTKETIRFAKPQSSCGCTNSRLNRNAISPGESTILSMEVNLEGKVGPRTFSTILVDDDKRVWRFYIHANTYKTLSFHPEGIHIGLLKPRATFKRQVAVVSCIPKSHETLPTVSLTPTQGPVATERSSDNTITHEDGIIKNTELLEVRVTAGDNPGFYSSEIVAQCHEPESGKTHTARIPVTWTVESLYSVSPPRVFIDDFLSNDSPVETRLSIKTLDSTPFEIDRVVCKNSAVTCELLASESSNRKRSLKVAVSPIGVRDYLYCELEVETNLPSQNHIVIPVVVVNSRRQRTRAGVVH